MFSNGNLVGDGSWELRVLVTDLNETRTLRVKGDTHIGGVMLALVEELGIYADWSDHALWWPERNMWLTRTRFTLDQYSVQADALLYFTPVHKRLRVQLPDCRTLEVRVDFSIKTFNSVVNLCKELGIRHPEELSFCHPLQPDHLKQNYTQSRNYKITHADELKRVIPPDTNTFVMTRGHHQFPPPVSSGCGPAPRRTPIDRDDVRPYVATPVEGQVGGFGHGPIYNEIDLEQLAGCPPPGVGGTPLRPKNQVEKARMNVAWLDSSLSIMEQGIRELDTLLLRFKFYAFYDLNPGLDSVRINQLYEQAKHQLLNEEVDCTEEEMLMFAALQLQVNLQANIPQPQSQSTQDLDDSIDAALDSLQLSLQQAPKNMSSAPSLSDVLRVLKGKKFTLKGFKKYYVTCRECYIMFGKSAGDLESGFSISLRGAEVTPDLSLSQGKYGIKLEVMGGDVGMTEYWLRCEDEHQYAKWLAACKLGSKGKSIADASYDSEVQTIKTFLAMQHRSQAPAINPNSFEIQPAEYVAPKFLKRTKTNKLQTRILEAHANVKDHNLIQAKMNYIKAWQSLPDSGISLFIVRFTGSKRDELLGVAFNRIMRMDLNTGDHIKTWRYNNMKAWNVNWEVKLMMIQLDDENISFGVQSADCKVVHEFIGGYIFLSLRSKESSQVLNEELFHKLTGGWN